MAIFGTPDEKETKKSERQKEREAYVQEENDQKANWAKMARHTSFHWTD